MYTFTVLVATSELTHVHTFLRLRRPELMLIYKSHPHSEFGGVTVPERKDTPPVQLRQGLYDTCHTTKLSYPIGAFSIRLKIGKCFVKVFPNAVVIEESRISQPNFLFALSEFNFLIACFFLAFRIACLSI